MTESPDTIHGRLLESVHVTGYTMGRACVALEWLLEGDRWKTIGDGFEKIDDFLATINLSQFKIAVDERKKLAKLLADKEATQRATAQAIGVTHTTIQRDLDDGTNVPRVQDVRTEKQESGTSVPPDEPQEPPPPALVMDGADVVKGLPGNGAGYWGNTYHHTTRFRRRHKCAKGARCTHRKTGIWHICATRRTARTAAARAGDGRG